MASIVLRITLAWMAALCLQAAGAAVPPPVAVLTIAGAISPATADYANRGIARAERDGAQLLVLMLDTPGGLDTSMRSIIKTILASPVPVATYVAPGGSRAASAGTYILYASHIAAMAPGTTLGAATPVELGLPHGAPEKKDKPAGKPDKPENKAPSPGSERPAAVEPEQGAMSKKQINDAAAYIRGLAGLRGRNAEWAELAVREAVSLSAAEALRMHVIDLEAPDLPALLQRLDGRRVVTADGESVLQTAGAPVTRHEPDWRTRMLAVITEPSIALILLAIGIYGLIFEFMSPGMVLPGVLGGICLLLALYALQLLPLNYAGLALIVLGIAFMIAEAFLPSFGTLGVGGIAAFVFGAVILIDTEIPGFGIPPGFIAGAAILSALMTAGIAAIAVKSRRRAVVSGGAVMIGCMAEVMEASPEETWVAYQGERWRAISVGQARLQPGQRVRIVGREGLLLQVAPTG